MTIKSLDPRVNRLHLPEPETAGEMAPLAPLDQFETYEVFHQRKEGMPFQHVGPVHAPNEEMAFLFGKEQYGRRFPCVAMWVAKTQNIWVTPHTDTEQSAYELINLDAGLSASNTGEGEKNFQVFHQKKRGKSHQHVGQVTAHNLQQAFAEAKKAFGHDVPCVNVWVIETVHLLQTNPADKDIWETTPEKKYRDAIAYKVQDRITEFKQQQQAAQ